MKRNMSNIEEALFNGIVIEYETYGDTKYKLYYNKEKNKYVMEWLVKPNYPTDHYTDKYKDLRSKNFNKVYNKSYTHYHTLKKEPKWMK